MFDHGSMLHLYRMNVFGNGSSIENYNPQSNDQIAWLVFAVTSIALAFLVHRRRGTSAQPGPDAAVPVVSTDLQNPVLIIHGHAQLMQGTGVVFDTRQHTAAAHAHTTAELAGVPARIGRERDGYDA